MSDKEDERDDGRLRGAIDAGRDLYRRGATAIAQTGGDNLALMLLASGVAAAGASWLVMRRRRTPGTRR